MSDRLDADAPVRAVPFEALERLLARRHEWDGDVLRVAFATPSRAARLCLYCRDPYEQDGVTYFRAQGCGHCTGGRHGRIGVFQLSTLDAQLRQELHRVVPH